MHSPAQPDVGAWGRSPQKPDLVLDVAQAARAARKAGARRELGASVLVWGTALTVASLFAWMIVDLAIRGLPALSTSFLLEAPRDAGRAGGIAPILVSTSLILSVCLAVSLPLGLATAILLAEFSDATSRAGRVVRQSLDVLAAVPSIVFGLFGAAFFCKTLGLGFSILAGGLTLACMVLPILIRSTEAGLRGVPQEWRAGAAALGISRTSTIVRLLLPAAVPGLTVGIVLGIGRALAETAALLFTSGYVDRMPSSLHDSGRALAIHVYDLSMNVPGGDRNAGATALVLVVLLLAINMSASAIADRALQRRLLIR